MLVAELNSRINESEIVGDRAAISSEMFFSEVFKPRRSSNMKKHALLFSASLLASTLIVPLGSSLAFAQAASDRAAADNTAQNQRDRDHQTLTPIDQSNKPADLETTRNIRSALVKDDQLSTEAKNVKIITVDGNVTLRGPVKSDQEKAAIMAKAAQVAGDAKINNELQVAGE